LAGSLPVPKKRPKKRKTFDQLSVNGRRRGLRDIRGLFKIKEVEYDAPVSRLAGFVIQQVIYFSVGNFAPSLPISVWPQRSLFIFIVEPRMTYHRTMSAASDIPNLKISADMNSPFATSENDECSNMSSNCL
jgi:hypothetical protein